MRVHAFSLIARLALAGVCLPPAAGSAQANPDGSVRVETTVPLSEHLSPEGREYLRRILVDRPFAGGPSAGADLAGYRARQDEIMLGFLKPMRERYAVRVEEQRIGGVLVDVVTPVAGVRPENRNRVLLNIHGGGFVSGARTAALVESVPIAAVMGVKVISIDYRMSPEFKFPAASEDIAAVYAEIIKTYRPGRVGVYGCSAGGMLTGQAVAWFHRNNLPQPGAVGVLCASLGQLVSGDAAALAGPLNGFKGPPAAAAPRTGPRPSMFPYLADASATDPLAYPATSPDLLRVFPPALLITGGRSMELSAATHSHNQLVKAGVDADLHVWDGMIHAFFYNSEMPESRDVYDVISRFFDKHLAR